MKTQAITVSVPGSIMLLGEHAVLHGSSAVVCAINRRLSITLEPRKDKKIFIQSEILGEYETHLNSLTIAKPFQFILAALLKFRKNLTKGFNVQIISEFNDQFGLGSSAAVSVAMVVVLHLYLHPKDTIQSIDPYQIFHDSLAVVHSVQGMGSGADVAASVFGGVIQYCVNPLIIKQMQIDVPLCLVYSGHKMPTVDVVKKVDDYAKRHATRVAHIYQEVERCVKLGIQAIQVHDWNQLGKIFVKHQSLQVQLGVSTHLLDGIVSELNGLSTVFGAKISGAGLGDCVVALGQVSHDYFPINDAQKNYGVKQIDITMSREGVF